MTVLHTSVDKAQTALPSILLNRNRMDHVPVFFNNRLRLCLVSRVDRSGRDTGAKSGFARNHGFREPDLSAPRGEGSCDMGIWLESSAGADCGNKPFSLVVQRAGRCEFPSASSY